MFRSLLISCQRASVDTHGEISITMQQWCHDGAMGVMIEHWRAEQQLMQSMSTVVRDAATSSQLSFIDGDKGWHVTRWQVSGETPWESCHCIPTITSLAEEKWIWLRCYVDYLKPASRLSEQSQLSRGHSGHRPWWQYTGHNPVTIFHTQQSYPFNSPFCQVSNLQLSVTEVIYIHPDSIKLPNQHRHRHWILPPLISQSPLLASNMPNFATKMLNINKVVQLN